MNTWLRDVGPIIKSKKHDSYKKKRRNNYIVMTDEQNARINDIIKECDDAGMTIYQTIKTIKESGIYYSSEGTLKNRITTMRRKTGTGKIYKTSNLTRDVFDKADKIIKENTTKQTQPREIKKILAQNGITISRSCLSRKIRELKENGL